FEGVAKEAKPPKDRKFVIIHKDVTVTPGLRLRLSTDPDSPTDCFVPCNLCGPAPQFKNNGTAILCEMGHIYLVGNICAAKHYEGVYEDANRIYYRDLAERRAQDYFYRHAGRIPSIVSHAQSLLEVAEAYAPAHKEIKRLPTFRKAMRAAIVDNGGWLLVKRLQEVQLGNGLSVPREVAENFARVAGETAVRSEFNFDTVLRSNMQFLEGFGDTEEAVLEGVIATQDTGKLPELHSAVLRATEAVSQARDGLVQFRLFFQPGNLENIQRWLRLRDCPVQCRADNDKHLWWFRNLSTERRRPIDTRVFAAPVPKPAD
ncbi:MAG: hypothetical protein Q8L84_02530, partial [Hyphomonas sp.]|nr:hypothetical protein [Hyphomonas sp.]